MGTEKVGDDASMLEAVVDAGPLIHLWEIGCLPLLRIFQSLHVPDAVFRESVTPARVPAGDFNSLAGVNRHTLDSTQVQTFIQAYGLGHLQPGELESLFLCQHLNLPILLTDDLAVRDTAHSLGITPIGSLGVILRSYRRGLVSQQEAEKHLLDLHDVSTLFVTKAIVEMAIEQLQQA